MIAITGANGHLGRATIKCLLRKMNGNNIIAIVRDPAKLQDFAGTGIIIKTADYEDPVSLNEALKGTDTLLQISTTSMGEQGIRHELNVVEAAKQQGIGYIVYTSGLKPNEGAHFLAVQQCLKTEEAIEDSGIDYTFLRNSLYMETIPLFIGNALEDGNIYFSAGKGKVSFVAREDIAEAVCIVLTEKGHRNKFYEITGDAAFSFEEIASLLTQKKGKKITYIDLPVEVLNAELLNSGMPEEEAGWFISLAESIKHNEFASVEDALKVLIQRKPMSFDAYIREL
ncbi:Quinone oxidoreductase 2 [compost metagenome]